MMGELASCPIDRAAQDVDHRKARVAQAVERTVERFPPLTSEQRARLARILGVDAAAEDAGAA